MKVLLLHGGPGATYEYFEAFDSYLPNEGIEYCYYNQLGSAFSDQPKGPSLWDLPGFVEEVVGRRRLVRIQRKIFCHQRRRSPGCGKACFRLSGATRDKVQPGRGGTALEPQTAPRLLGSKIFTKLGRS